MSGTKSIFKHPSLIAALLLAPLLSGAESPLAQEIKTSSAPAVAGKLAISEINYHPRDPSAAELAIDSNFDSDSFEFIEFLNISVETLDMSNVALDIGVKYSFGSIGAPMLAPGQRLVVVRDRDGFQARYGASIPIAGVFTSGKLSDGGEEIGLVNATGAQILLFEYNDAGGWPGRADGNGSSLELEDPYSTPAADYGKSGQWRSSAEHNGSPGTAGTGRVRNIIINEVLTHTDPPWVDYIELLNITTSAVQIAGWYLSDGNDYGYKYEIPSDTPPLAPGAYAVFDEKDFNPTPANPLPNHFALSGAHGDHVWLFSKDAQGVFRFVDDVEFGASANGEPFGRWPNGSGNLYPMTARTLGAANSGPRVGPLIISELHYHPTDDTPPVGMTPDDFEFVEIHNPTAYAEVLSNWRLRRSVDYDFPPNAIIAPYGVIVIVSFDPLVDSAKLAAFRSTYNVSLSVALLGPYSVPLDNGGAAVQLQRPDEPPLEEPDFYPPMVEDEIDYNDKAPWPLEPDGLGKSLTRQAVDAWGNDAASWKAATPTPGKVAFGDFAPSIVSTPHSAVPVGHLYAYTVYVTGFPAPAISVEGLPIWLTFDDINTISGTPAAAHLGTTLPITITAINNVGTDTQQFTIEVIPGLHPPSGAATWMIR